MTLGEMLTDLGARIGSSPEVSNANMTTWINEALRVFCAESDFTWLEKRVTSSTVADQDEYELPTDFKKMVEIRVDPTDSDPGVYTYLPYEQRYGIDSSEKTYSITGSVLRLTPVPDATDSNNIYMTYIRRPTNLVDSSDDPSDTEFAGMPEVFHPALVQYAFAIYQSYDEEQGEFESLMGGANSPVRGTYSWYVQLAKKESEEQKRGSRRRMLSKQEMFGYTKPNRTGRRPSAVLGI